MSLSTIVSALIILKKSRIGVPRPDAAWFSSSKEINKKNPSTQINSSLFHTMLYLVDQKNATVAKQLRKQQIFVCLFVFLQKNSYH